MPRRGTDPQYIQPPNPSFSGTPSSSTSARETPEGPMPRRLTPCELGSATRLDDLRKTANDGSRRNASSTDLARPISAPGIDVTGAVASCDGSAARAEVTTIVSLISSPDT